MLVFPVIVNADNLVLSLRDEGKFCGKVASEARYLKCSIHLLSVRHTSNRFQTYKNMKVWDDSQ